MTANKLTLERVLDLAQECDVTEEELKSFNSNFNEEDLQELVDTLGDKITDESAVKEEIEWLATVYVVVVDKGLLPFSVPEYLIGLTEEEIKNLTREQREDLHKKWLLKYQNQ